MIRVLVADDHTMVREGLKQILAASGDMIVAGEASDGTQTLEMACDGDWDVLLLDLSMPGRSGVDLIKQIKRNKPELPILILSMHKEDEYTIRTIRAGAAGYLCKDGASEQLLTAIRKVAKGGHFISPEVASDLAVGLILKSEQQLHSRLSDRELQIFRLITRGIGINDIAQNLNLSAKTVSTYKSRILQKMQMSRITDLIRYGLEHDLIEDAEEEE
ncbi:response regulator [Propionivibrio sp.]|uniref:response regulator n=1 Tax=Propionivibrio sp. TaxID=2212460 RepID=UPI003BF37660